MDNTIVFASIVTIPSPTHSLTSKPSVVVPWLADCFYTVYTPQSGPIWGS